MNFIKSFKEAQSMPEAQIGALIKLYDDTIRLRQKLLDYDFAEEVLSAVPDCLVNERMLEAYLEEKTDEYEQLKKYSEMAQDRISELYSEFDDLTKYYQLVERFDYAEQIHDFEIFLKNRSESGDKNDTTLNSESKNWFKRYENSLRKYFTEQLNADNIKLKHELEELKLQLEKTTRESETLRTCLNIANEDISTLNSNLTSVLESWHVEKSLRERAENERENLENLSEKLRCSLLKYQLNFRPLDETKPTDALLRYHSTIDESSRTEIKSEIDYDDDGPLPPPTNFQNDHLPSAENVNANEFISEEKKYDAAALDATLNSSVRRELGDSVIDRNSYLFPSSSACSSSISSTLSATCSQSNVSEFKSNHTYSIQESQDTNFGINYSESSAAQVSREPLKPNEKSALSQTSTNRAEKLVSSADEFSKTPTPSQSFHCEKCDKSFKERGRILEKCPICDPRYPFRRIKRSLDSPSEPLAIKKSKKSRASNVKDIVKNNQSRVSALCVICNRYYSSKYILKYHIRRIHNGEKDFKCTSCGKRYARKYDLKRHTLTHEPKKTFNCPVCNMGFSTATAERKHERMYHEMYQCAHCDKKYTQKRMLISHLQKKHFRGLLKPFRCTIRDKSFSLKQLSKNRHSVHSSEKPFKCSTCDTRFTQLSNQKRHEKNFHNKQKNQPLPNCVL